jgi:hypothetical protein
MCRVWHRSEHQHQPQLRTVGAGRGKAQAEGITIQDAAGKGGGLLSREISCRATIALEGRQ